ncbi:MAG TPA: hypothetical protein VK110_11110, partial [Salinisphaeraceae bacterium]|nr:hypothetical protein [Salinisphaeraceae bacterium]
AESITGGQKLPGPGSRYEMCGPGAEALRDMMRCAAGGVAGIDADGNPITMPGDEPDFGSGLGNTTGNIDPSMEQWISNTYGDNVFARCTQQEGFNVVGRDGTPYTIGGSSDWRSGQQCGALDCRPPARARNVGGTCRCVASDGSAAAVQAAIARNIERRTCSVMTVNCEANPSSPCCAGSSAGGVPDIPDIDQGRVFDIDEVTVPDFKRLDDIIKLDVIDSIITEPVGNRAPDNLP